MSAWFANGCLAATLALLLAGPAWGQAGSPSVQEIAADLGFDAAAIRRAQAGEIVSRSIQESSRNEIGAAVAMLAKAPAEQLRERIAGAGFVDLDPSVLAHGRIQVPASAASFAGLRIPPVELERLANAAPGDDLNLSSEEIAALRATAPKGAEAVGDAWRGLLAERIEAYRRNGLAGIAPYARANGRSTSAADALRSATEAAVVLRKRAPSFHAALAGYPKGVPAGTEERFSWALVDVQGRPAVVLAHRLVGPEGDVTVVADRQLYVSQGYNALQIVVGLFPVQEGTAVIYVNRTHSDQAARFGRVAQGMGRRMLVGEVTRFFEAARRAAGG